MNLTLSVEMSSLALQKRTDMYQESRSKTLVVGVKQFIYPGEATEKWDVSQDFGIVLNLCHIGLLRQFQGYVGCRFKILMGSRIG